MTERKIVQEMNERRVVQDPSLICFVNELMTLAKEGYELDPEMYPNTFGGLYHTCVLKPSALKANEGVIELTQEQAERLDEYFKQTDDPVIEPDEVSFAEGEDNPLVKIDGPTVVQTGTKRGPKTKGNK